MRHDDARTISTPPDTGKRCGPRFLMKTRSALRAIARHIFMVGPSKRRQRMALLELDTRLLNDIGITYAEAKKESKKSLFNK